MNEKRWKIYFWARAAVSSLFGAGVGVACLMLRPYAREVFDILVIAMGLLTVIMHLPLLVKSFARLKTKKGVISFCVALGAVLLGVALMLLRRKFLLVLLGAYSIVFPLLRIAFASDHRLQLRREAPCILAGLVMLAVFLFEAEALVFLVGAIVAFVLTGLYLFWMVFSYHWISRHAASEEPQEGSGSQK